MDAISHVMPTLAVTDLKRAKEFYGEILGLEVVHSFMPNADALYRLGGETYLYIYERSTASGSTATACAFQVDDVEQAVKELRGRGVQFEEYHFPEMGLDTVDGVAAIGDVKSAWFKDPSGNILALDDGLAVMQAKKKAA